MINLDHKFKIGDRVKLNSTRNVVGDLQVGDIGTVVDHEVYPDITFNTVVFDCIGYTQICEDRELDLVKDNGRD